MTKQLTVRVPDALEQFVREQARTTHRNNTDVVIAALQAEKRRVDIAHELEILNGIEGDIYPDIEPMSLADAARVWADLD